MVIWFLGISGAGKTTLGKKLQQYFLQRNHPSYLIDGDLVRSFFDNDLGYSTKDRQDNIKRIIFAAHVLDENNITTIVCNISPFESLRQMARSKIRNYNEIYLKRDLEICKRNDVKRVYGNNLGKTDVIGVDIPFEEPSNSDLVVDTFLHDEAESLSKIIEYLDKKTGV